jgi:GntR family transcriptional regulator, histidine utilization repressor
MTSAIKAPTLHRRIRSDIEENILSGKWPPGTRIPNEHELTAHYGCARMTVNKVIAQLVSAGLIERRRRAGSFVAQPRFESAVLHIPDIPVEIAARGEAYTYELLSCRRHSREEASALETGLPDGAGLIEVNCRHLANGAPLALEHRLIALQSVPEAADADFSAGPPGSWLLAHVPWTQAEHRISAANASAREAKLLGVDKGAACLTVERRTWRMSALLTSVTLLFRGDQYNLVARFSPQA